MKIVVDMSLTPAWVPALQKYGWECRHWMTIGDPRAEDTTIMAWARANDYIVLTHDLDFGAILAATGVNSPSGVQIRAQCVVPFCLEELLVTSLQQFKQLLTEGALIVVDEARSRAIALPLKRH